MPSRCSVNCIVPPHILQRMLESADEELREIALNTLLATTRLRAERSMVAELGFAPNITGTKRRTIYNCDNRRVLSQAVLVRGEGDDPVRDTATNQAYDGLGQTYDFFKAVLDRNSIDDRGMRLDGYVHYGSRYNNAFWDGRHMVFGDGDGRRFIDFTKSLDVIAHELTHGVTEFTAGLTYHNQSGALNESVSDVFGSLVKQWSLKQTADQADWLIGSDVFSPLIAGDALRSMKSPGNAYNDPTLGRDPQPDHMDRFVHLPDTEEGDWGGVHINSGIPNHAFFQAATAIGGYAWEAAGHIWYETLKSSTQNTEFQEFADKSYFTAGRLYGSGSVEQQAVQDAWGRVGIRISRLTPPGGRRAYSPLGADGQSVLVTQIEALREEVKVLADLVKKLSERH